MEKIIDYVVLAIYALVMVGIAIYTRKRSKSVDDFLLAGKKGLNGWLTAFAYGTTYFSAVIFIGYAGQFGRAYGLASIWIGIGNAIIGTLIAWLVLARRTKNMTQRLDAKTMPEFFEKRYNSKALKFVSAIIIFIFLVPYSASVYNGISSLFEIVFGIDGWIIMLVLAIITALYLFFGGYFATAVSDFIQGIIMIVGVVVMFVFFMQRPEVEWDISSLANNPLLGLFTFSGEAYRDGHWLYGPTMSLVSLVLLTSLGVWALPQTIHKYYAIRDKKAIVQGVVISTLFAIVIGFVAYFIGSLSNLFPQDAIQNASDSTVVPEMLKLVIPAGLKGLIAILILSASMSTLASVSLASASVVAVDLYKGIGIHNESRNKLNKKGGFILAPSDRRVNLVMRLLCLLFIVVSVVIAILNEKYNITAIAYLMGLSWGTLAGCFIGPYVLGVVWKRVTKPAVWASIVSSLVLTVALILIFGYHKNNWVADFGTALKSGMSCSPMIGVICMISSLLVTTVVSLLTKAPNKEVLDNAFEKHIDNEIPKLFTIKKSKAVVASKNSLDEIGLNSSPSDDEIKE